MTSAATLWKVKNSFPYMLNPSSSLSSNRRGRAAPENVAFVECPCNSTYRLYHDREKSLKMISSLQTEKPNHDECTARGVHTHFDVLLQETKLNENFSTKLRGTKQLELCLERTAGNVRFLDVITEYSVLYRCQVGTQASQDDFQDEIIERVIAKIRRIGNNENAVFFFVRSGSAWRRASDDQITTTVESFLDSALELNDASDRNQELLSIDEPVRQALSNSSAPICDPNTGSHIKSHNSMRAAQDINVTVSNIIHEVTPNVWRYGPWDEDITTRRPESSDVKQVLLRRVLERNDVTMIEPHKMDIVFGKSELCREWAGNKRCKSVLEKYADVFSSSENDHERYAIISAICMTLKDGDRIQIYRHLQYGHDHAWWRLTDIELRVAICCNLVALSSVKDSATIRKHISARVLCANAHISDSTSLADIIGKIQSPSFAKHDRKRKVTTSASDGNQTYIQKRRRLLHLCKYNPSQNQQLNRLKDPNNRNYDIGCSELSQFDPKLAAPTIDSHPTILARCSTQESSCISQVYETLDTAWNEASVNDSEVTESDRFYYLGLAHLDGSIGVPQSNREAIDYLLRAMNNGHLMAPACLGYMYMRGAYGLPKRFSEAARLYKLSAERGVGIAQYMVGRMYQHGRGVLKDLITAAKYFHMASEHGISKLQFNIGQCLESGYVTLAALPFFRRAAEEEKSIDAQMRLGQVYKEGNGIYPDSVKVCRYLEMAANQGHAEAQYKLGEMYRTGDGIQQDYSRAGQYYNLAADQGHSDAQFQFALLHRKGSGVERNNTIAARYYRAAAKQGNHRALFSLAVMHRQGAGIEKNDAKAARLYRLAAERGNINAQFNLASMLLDGDGVEKDLAKAAHFFRMAAIHGDVEAQYNLANMHREGVGMPKDFAKAAALYRLAAEQGDSSAQCNLANMYRNGQGVAQDPQKAARLYQIAANNGNANAQCNLGAMFFSGVHTRQNYTEAERLFRLAADQGNNHAQFNLALMYRKGYGVAQDFTEAARLYTLSAEKGDKTAQYILGFICYLGEGVTKDLPAALKWLNKSADQGFVDAHIAAGQMYARGEGTVETAEQDAEGVMVFREDPDAAISHFLSAIELNGEAASEWLNFHALEVHDLCLNIDRELVIEHLMLASERGSSIAQHQLGLAYEMGRVVSIDHTEALRYYRMAMNQNNMGACVDAAKLWSCGWYPHFDMGASLKCLKHAAGSNDPKACREFGSKAANGFCEHKNLNLAISLYEVAASKNCRKARSQMGSMLYSGYTVGSISNKSAKNLEEASGEGDITASAYLGRMNILGNDIDFDRDQGIELCKLVSEEAFQTADSFFDNLQR